MPKRIAIVDIGSNSARVVIYQRTSRFGFHLVAQKKASVRISEGSFENGGVLQKKAMARTLEALHAFKEIIELYKARKTIVVATAAVRNAPNKEEFLSLARKEVGFNIKVIDGNKEAYFGAIAAKNLLPRLKDSLTIDIGGGSTDIALIQNSKVTDTLSLNLGTITIKELFFDKNRPAREALSYIKQEMQKIPHHFKQALQIVAIGGVLRALAKSIMEQSNYSYKKIHAFEYDFQKHSQHMESIVNVTDNSDLEKLFIKPSRYDTIREGLLIFQTFVDFVDTHSIITSGVGVREGIFLHDMLRGVGGVFPKEINPSIVSITDRLDMLKIPSRPRVKIVKNLFATFSDKVGTEFDYIKLLTDAIKISDVGKTLTIYNEHKHAYYIAQQELNWQYTHSEMLLISALLRLQSDKIIYKTLQKENKKLLPSRKTLKWLGFIYTLSDILSNHSLKNSYTFQYKEGCLQIYSNNPIYLFEQETLSLKFPEKMRIETFQY